MNPDGRYFCESCERRYNAPGDCTHCPEEPLLDLLDEDVLLMLEKWDDDRWQKRLMQFTLLAGVVCSPLAFAALAWTKLILAVYVAAVSGASITLIKLFPPPRKCPDMGHAR